MKKLLKKLWGPEDITYYIYKKLTNVRKPILYILLIFIFANIIYPNSKLPSFSSEFFAEALKAMINVLLAVGAIIATFVAIALEIIRKQERAEYVTDLWRKFAIYIIYPFTIATFAGIVLFLKGVGADISKTDLSFSILLLFGYLTVNSIYIIVKAGEDLVNEGWAIKIKEDDKSKNSTLNN